MNRYNYSQIHDFTRQCLNSQGFQLGDVDYMAELIVETEARGFQTHGLRQLNLYCGMWDSNFNGSTQPELIRETDSIAVFSGLNRCPSLLILRHAMEVAAKKADVSGIAHMAIQDTDWIAAPGPHLIRLANRGFLAIIYVHNCGWACCAPFHGAAARLTTNPLAFAIPRANTFPIVADFSTSGLSLGKVGVMKRAGQKTDVARFIDANGNLTNDPVVMSDGGAMLPWGGMEEGYKGTAIALFNEAVIAVSGGSAQNPAKPPVQNYSLTVFSPRVLSSENYFLEEMRRLAEYVKNTPALSGTPGVFLPGEQSHWKWQESIKKGIPVTGQIVEEMKEVGQHCGVIFPDPL